MTRAIAIETDPNNHDLGNLISGQTKVYIKNLPVIRKGDLAFPDDECGEEGEPPTHCTPNAVDGSIKVFVGGLGVHKDGGFRLCGAITESVNRKVYTG